MSLELVPSQARPGPARRIILGVPVVSATADEAVDLLDDALDAQETVRLAFLNAHSSNLAAFDPAFRAALDRCLVLNDGIGVELAARMLHGDGFPANLNGTDFIPQYLKQTRHPLRIALLGARPGVPERVARALGALDPRHSFVYVRNGYFEPRDLPGLLADLRDAAPDLLLIAFGNPAQELFMADYGDATGARLMAGVGGLFDFVVGEKPRAPRLIRRAGMEWAFRLSVEPRRMWRRYVVGNPLFLARVAARRLASRGRAI